MKLTSIANAVLVSTLLSASALSAQAAVAADANRPHIFRGVGDRASAEFQQREAHAGFGEGVRQVHRSA